MGSSEEKPYMIVKPSAKIATLAYSIPAFLILLALGGLPTLILMDRTAGGVPISYDFFLKNWPLFAAYGMCIITLFCLFFRFMLSRNAEFRFFDDRIETYSRFLVTLKGKAKYEEITDVRLRKGVIEELSGRGTVSVLYPDYVGGPFNGVCLYYIKDPEKIYEKIQDIMKKYKDKR